MVRAGAGEVFQKLSFTVTGWRGSPCTRVFAGYRPFPAPFGTFTHPSHPLRVV